MRDKRIGEASLADTQELTKWVENVDDFGSAPLSNKPSSTSRRPSALRAPIDGKVSSQLPSRRLLPDRPQDPIDRLFQSLETGRVTRLAACDENVMRIRRPQQPPAVGSLHPHAVDIIETSTVSTQSPLDLLDKGKFARVWDGEPDLRRIGDRGPCVPYLREGLLGTANDAHQAYRGIERIVVAEIWFAEEDVAAHFAGERRSCFCHFCFDERMAGAPHQRLASAARNLIEKQLAGFDVCDDCRAGSYLQHIIGKQNH